MIIGRTSTLCHISPASYAIYLFFLHLSEHKVEHFKQLLSERSLKCKELVFADIEHVFLWMWNIFSKSMRIAGSGFAVGDLCF